MIRKAVVSGYWLGTRSGRLTKLRVFTATTQFAQFHIGNNLCNNIYLYFNRYLATGCTFVSLSLYFAKGETKVGTVVHETTKVIWDTLNEKYTPVPTREHWKLIADSFESILNLPNCTEPLIRKHG